MHPPVVRELEGLARRVVEASRLEEPAREAVASSSAGRRPVIVAFGKGACSMARGALEALGSAEGGVVVVPEGMACSLPGLETLESTHPLPSERSVRAAEAVLEWARTARSSGRTLVALISGGGSALVEKPVEGIPLEDLVEANRVLLQSGLSILEINTVRKHLSLVKGGRLAAAASPARVVGVYASDVPGDRLDLIASGPTVPDPSTFEDALRIVRAYGLERRLPESIVRALERGARGEIPETPKPGDPVFRSVENRLCASNMTVLAGLSRILREELGYEALILTSRIEGESREVGKALASIALEALERGVPAGPPLALLVGGETSVTVRNPRGRGGRNMELALSTAARIDYWRPDLEPGKIAVLSMDTDGIDGNTDAAGAIAYNGITRVAREKGLDPLEALEENNTYDLFDRLGLLLRTGPTGSNLNSVTVILVR